MSKTAVKFEVNIFDKELPSNTMVSLDNICDALNIGDQRTWLKWCRQGQAPAPYPVGTSHCLRWNLGEIREYLEARRNEYKQQNGLL